MVLSITQHAGELIAYADDHEHDKRGGKPFERPHGSI